MYIWGFIHTTHLLEQAQATYFLNVNRLIHTYRNFKLNKPIAQTDTAANYKNV